MCYLKNTNNLNNNNNNNKKTVFLGENELENESSVT